MSTEHFTDEELACPCCGELYDEEDAATHLALIEALRRELGPVRLNSAHRCGPHNAIVGGAPLSMHKKLAFDVAIGTMDRGHVLAAAKRTGFRGFGLGQTFVHLDAGRARTWDYGAISRKLWEGKT